MSTALVVIGTRPEAIKLAPVAVALRTSPFSPYVLCTSQHVGMVQQVMKVFGVEPDEWLPERKKLEKLSHSSYLAGNTALIMDQITEVVDRVKPTVIIVQGDTISTLAGALVGYFSRIPVAHVEAGLRSGDFDHPFPEEFNRVTIGPMATHHFPPTEESLKNLLADGISEDKCTVVGNTVVDALFTVRDLPRSVVLKKPIILVTAHRRESWGEPMQRICEAIKLLAETHPDEEIHFFAHPNPIVRKTVNQVLGNEATLPNCHIRDALGYQEFADYLLQSKLVITDSGGLQEETSVLGIPTIVTRETTERVEGLYPDGPLKLVGTKTDVIFKEAHELLTDMEIYHERAKQVTTYGLGDTSKKIVEILSADLA